MIVNRFKPPISAILYMVYGGMLLLALSIVLTVYYNNKVEMLLGVSISEMYKMKAFCERGLPSDKVCLPDFRLVD